MRRLCETVQKAPGSQLRVCGLFNKKKLNTVFQSVNCQLVNLSMEYLAPVNIISILRNKHLNMKKVFLIVPLFVATVLNGQIETPEFNSKEFLQYKIQKITIVCVGEMNRSSEEGNFQIFISL